MKPMTEEEFDTLQSNVEGETMKWVNVNDALPPIKKRVLVVAKPHKDVRPGVYISKLIPHDTANPNCTRVHWANFVKDEDVKFWQPLPNVPKF